MKKILLLVFLLIMSANVFSAEVYYDSVKIYGVPEDVLYRFPITKQNITKYYGWMCEKRSAKFNVEKIKNYSLPENYDKYIIIRIDLVCNEKVTTLCFDDENIQCVKDEIKRQFVDF